MAKGYLSNRQQNLKIGISSYTENDTVFEIIGNSNISGIVTASYFYGDGSNLTNITVGGGAAGDIKILDDISGSFNGITTSFTLSSDNTSINAANSQSLIINLGGVIQDPLDDYSVSGSNIVFSVAPESGLTFSGIYFNFGAFGTIADGSVTPQMLSTGGPWWTTESYVGIGTTVPTSALDVVGDIRTSSDVYVDTIRRSTDNSTNTKIVLDPGSLKFYSGNGVSPKLTLNGGVGINTNLNVTGVITAIGGFNLGISSAGTPITTGPITTLNFVGAGNTFAVNGTTVDISIAGGGGGSSVSISTEAPADPNEGDLWYSSVLGRTFIYYVDDDSSQWVDASPFNIPEPDATPGKTSSTITATEGQTLFSVSYKVGFIDVFLNGIRLNSSEFIAGNGTSITLITPASLNDVLDVVEYTMGIGDTGPQGAAGPLEGVIEATTDQVFYPLIVTGIGTSIPRITTTNDYFEFNPSSGTLTTNQLNVVGVVTATDFNSSSDFNLKTNIRNIEDSVDKILQINGVEFNWKETQEPSMGVIAQEIEKVFPSLVKTSENKSVNYNGLIGVLIEAVKEQQKQINILKEEIKLLKEK